MPTQQGVEILASDIAVELDQKSTGVTITHLPTEITVYCKNHQSAHSNKAKAMELLKEKLDRQEHLTIVKMYQTTDGRRFAKKKDALKVQRKMNFEKRYPGYTIKNDNGTTIADLSSWIVNNSGFVLALLGRDE